MVEDADFDGEVEVTITDFAFGGSIDEPDSFDAFNGTVTITSISDLSAVGTYDIGIDTNSNDIADLFFNGSFDFDLE